MAANVASFEKFTGKNSFSLWRIKMRAILVQQGLVKALNGKDKLPNSLTDEQKDELMERAHSTILLSLGDEVLQEVADVTTAPSLWLRLESKYMTKSLTKRLYLKQRLYTLKMGEGTSLSQHLDNFNSIIMDLNIIDIKIDDEDQALIVLCSLPPSYENFVESMLYGHEEITLDEVKTALGSNQLRKQLSGKAIESSQGEGLVTRGRSKFRGRNSDQKASRSQSRKRVQCYYCKKFGHIRRDCPKKKDKGESQVQSKSDANVVVAQSSDDAETVLIVSDSQISEKWILDTGATFHVSTSREMFSSYEKCTGSVLIGNDYAWFSSYQDV